MLKLIGFLGILLTSSWVAAHPLEDAARDAAAKCAVFESSIERCTELPGKEAAGARRAVIDMHNANLAFQMVCQSTADFKPCNDEAYRLITAGIRATQRPAAVVTRVPDGVPFVTEIRLDGAQ